MGRPREAGRCWPGCWAADHCEIAACSDPAEHLSELRLNILVVDELIDVEVLVAIHVQAIVGLEFLGGSLFRESWLSRSSSTGQQMIRSPTWGHNRREKPLGTGNATGNIASGPESCLLVVDLRAVVRVVLKGLGGLAPARSSRLLDGEIGHPARRTAADLRRLTRRIVVVGVKRQQVCLDFPRLLVIFGPNLGRLPLPHCARDDR